MENLRDRYRLLLTLAAIAVSVFLFACGGPGGRSSEGPDTASVPADPTPTTASLSSPEPGPAITVLTAEPPTPPAQETGPPVAEDSAPAPGSSALPVSDSTGHRVFTNKDLDRYRKVKEEFGFSGDVVTVDLTGKKPATPEESQRAGAQLTDEQRDEEMRTTREKIVALTAESQYLRGRIPSLHNPLLPRATLSEPDKIAESGMDNVQRLSKITSRLAEVDAELNALQRRFAELSQMKPAGPAAP